MLLASGASLLLHPAYLSHSLVLMYFCSQVFGTELPVDTSPLVQQHTSCTLVRFLFDSKVKQSFEKLQTTLIQSPVSRESTKLQSDKGHITRRCDDLIKSNPHLRRNNFCENPEKEKRIQRLSSCNIPYNYQERPTDVNVCLFRPERAKI